MMICEQCQQEMTASLVKCEHCGYNPALQRLDAWRERRQRISSAHESKSLEPPPTSTEARRSSAKDATLIRFPKRPANPAPMSPTPSTEPPPWRNRLDARLQEIREQRAMEVEPPPSPVSAPKVLDQNPIVAKALNRIQRANYLQPITPLPHSRSAVAEELAPLVETAPATVPYLEAKAAAATMARTATAPMPHIVAEALVESSPAAIAEEEDLLADLLLEPTPPSVATNVPPVETPTSLEPASLGKRAAAAVIDAEIIASSLLPLFGAYFFLSGWFEAPTILLPIAVGVILITVYFFVTY
ncbi:MAG TPA: hypothetical protein VFZ34_30045, partial [Blastocatellia bacterium]|nr:hypothetical protein [Blastocatellia bacterium]